MIFPYFIDFITFQNIFVPYLFFFLFDQIIDKLYLGYSSSIIYHLLMALTCSFSSWASWQLLSHFLLCVFLIFLCTLGSSLTGIASFFHLSLHILDFSRVVSIFGSFFRSCSVLGYLIHSTVTGLFKLLLLLFRLIHTRICHVSFILWCCV